MPRSKKSNIVPKEGGVDPKNLFRDKGFCGICGEDKPFLRQHYEDRHTGKVKKRLRRGPRGLVTNKLTLIPKEGDVDPDSLYTSGGTCDICDMDPTHLQRHYLTVHVNQRKELVTVIKEGDKWTALEVTRYEGTCFMKPCKGNQLKQLRGHYKSMHLKEQRKCNVCKKMVPVSRYQRHLKSHSGPAKCSKCGEISQSVYASTTHVSRHHPGTQNVHPVLLNKEESAKYFKRLEFFKKMKKIGRRRQGIVIRDHASKLREYQKRLKDSKDSLSKRMEAMKEKFQSLVKKLPANSVVVYHACHVSAWCEDWKTPSLVFETITKPAFDENTRFRAHAFFVDPQIAKQSQPRYMDYKGSKMDRGHLSAAASFRYEELVASTYYYTNVVPMHPCFNRGPRYELEHFVRETAVIYGRVDALHFPIMDGPVKVIGRLGIRVPSFVCTVIMFQKKDGAYILAWKLPNKNYRYDFEKYSADPFEILKDAGIRVTFKRKEFVYASKEN